MPLFGRLFHPPLLWSSICARLVDRTFIQFRQCSAAVVPSNPSADNKFLSADFILANEWHGRLDQMSVDELGGDNFEWVIAVQKKFSGGGRASAVDLDLACFVSVDPEQVADLVDLCYKLRHTDSAADLLPSTEYTVCRLLLETNDLDNFMKILNDPMNYGLFPNEHLCCMFLDHLLVSSANLQYSAKVAIYVMLQEMFECPLLTFISTRALLEWSELPHGERILNDQIHPKVPPMLEDETNFNEENVHLFRYPFLKNPFWDGHFDESDADQLAGKSLEWLSWHLKLADTDGKSCNEALIRLVRIVGLVMQRKWAEAKRLTEETLENVGPSGDEHQISCSAVQHLQQLLNCAEAAEERREDEKSDETAKSPAKMELKKLLEQKSADLGVEKANASEIVSLSAVLAQRFQPILGEEEGRLMERQREHFAQWAHHRKRLIHSQAQRVEHLARLTEIRKRTAELREQREMLHFFENRVRIEDEARERTELIEELGLMKKRGDLTEEEYAKSIFHLARQLKEGKTAKQALDEISGSDLLSRLQNRTV